MKTQAPLVAMLCLLFASCAFNTKEYVSQVVLDGPNYRGNVYDEGVFYVNDEPSISLEMGCYMRTQLGESMSFLIPMPAKQVANPHESIAADRFSLALGVKKGVELDLSSIAITIEISGAVHPIPFDRLEEERLASRAFYHFKSELSCGDIVNGALTIPINKQTTRVYGAHFEELENSEGQLSHGIRNVATD